MLFMALGLTATYRIRPLVSIAEVTDRQSATWQFLVCWVLSLGALVPAFGLYAFAPERVQQLMLWMFEAVRLRDSWIHRFHGSRMVLLALRAIGIFGLATVPVFLFGALMMAIALLQAGTH
jgi:hypothetical protein